MRTATTTAPATERQLALIAKLAPEYLALATDSTNETHQLRASVIRHVAVITPANRGDASRVIDDMLGDIKAMRAAAATKAAGRGATKDGFYLLDGTVYKVQYAVHGTGNLYAKRLVISWECEGHPTTYGATEYCDGTCRSGEQHATFEYAPGMVRRLSADNLLTLEQAKEYGQLYGVCCICGKTLTNEESIAAGIGPICAKRF